MGVLVASMGGVILTSFSLSKKYGGKILHTRSHELAWLIGAAVGFINVILGGLLSPIAIVDALVAAGASLLLLRINIITTGEVNEIYRNERS